MAQRQGERHCVDPQHREILSQHNFNVTRREREQQLVSTLLSLFSPHRHGQRWDKEHQQVRKPPAELIEGRQIIEEELILPERRCRA